MSRIALLAAVLGLIAGSLPGAVRAELQGRHLATEPCFTCHLTRAKGQVVNPRRLLSSQEQLCKRCHANAILVGHPSGIAPLRPLPSGFPLDFKGDLTCSSCHRVHGAKSGLSRTDVRGRDYCLSCHEKEFFERMADLGTALFVSGHIAGAAGGDGFEADVDSYTVNCLGCHDNQADELVVSVQSDGVSHAVANISHPVGRDYRKAMTYGSYRPVGQVPDNILLPEGKVSCVSCHRGYSRQHGALVSPGNGSALCFNCHDL